MKAISLAGNDQILPHQQSALKQEKSALYLELE